MPIPAGRKFEIHGEDKTDALLLFAETMGLNRLAPGRYSSLFLVDLYHHTVELGVNPFKVMDEIRALEDASHKSRTKPATQFERTPLLRGLWHKHYMGTGVPSLAKNILNGLGKHGMKELAAAELADREITEEAIARFTHRLVQGTFELRCEEGKLTGEWIIFAKHNGGNFYLCLGGHTWGDEYIATRIQELCVPEFPFLSASQNLA
ncbi:hypothetical protein EGT07_08055 [Herbaspirillum sp. HC18]|nr:hypothetical protein EGT07_08055 [Herbaspirillum sp. HC18]